MSNNNVQESIFNPGQFNNLVQHCIVGFGKSTNYNVANDKIPQNDSPRKREHIQTTPNQ